MNPKYLGSLILMMFFMSIGLAEYNRVYTVIPVLLFFALVKVAFMMQKYEEKQISMIKNSSSYIHVKNFVKTYDVNNISNTSSTIILDPKEFVALLDLLKRDRLKIDRDSLVSLLKAENKQQKYEDFKNKMLYNNPFIEADYIHNLLEIYGENFSKYEGNLKDLLKERRVKTDYGIGSRIKEMKKEIELNQFERKISGNQRNLSIDDLDTLSGYEFEVFLSQLYVGMGYTVESTNLSHDQGADLVLTKFGEKTVVQAKRYSNSVGNKAIQEIVAAKAYYGAQIGIVVTTSTFTSSAIELAEANNIQLIDRIKLAKMINSTYSPPIDMTPERTFYDILGIKPNATSEQIKEIYRKLSLIYHPDTGKELGVDGDQRFREIKEAYEILIDPASRKEYDKKIGVRV